jgi:hypothetical protein
MSWLEGIAGSLDWMYEFNFAILWCEMTPTKGYEGQAIVAAIFLLRCCALYYFGYKKAFANFFYHACGSSLCARTLI